MTESYKYWLDVDKPSGVVMLHVVGCRYEADKSDTEFKGLGHLKCDGGWLGFETREAADLHARAKLRRYKRMACRWCM